MLEVSGDTNHAGASPVTPPRRSKGLLQEPQPVPGLPGDFKACWPSRSGVCRDETHLSIFASPDTDLPLWKLLIRVIRAPFRYAAPLCHEWPVFQGEHTPASGAARRSTSCMTCAISLQLSVRTAGRDSMPCRQEAGSRAGSLPAGCTWPSFVADEQRK